MYLRRRNLPGGCPGFCSSGLGGEGGFSGLSVNLPPPHIPRPLGCLSTRPGQLCAGLADGGRFCTRTLKHTHTLFFFITSDLERIPQAFAEINRTARKLRSAYGLALFVFPVGDALSTLPD